MNVSLMKLIVLTVDFTMLLKKESISMTVRYDVEKVAYASHLKANIQAAKRSFYLRELAASEVKLNSRIYSNLRNNLLN